MESSSPACEQIQHYIKVPDLIWFSISTKYTSCFQADKCAEEWPAPRNRAHIPPHLRELEESELWSGGERESGEGEKEKKKETPFLHFPALSKLENMRQKPCPVFCVSSNYIPAAGQFPAAGRPPSPHRECLSGGPLLVWLLSLLPVTAPSHFGKGGIATLSPTFTASHILMPFLISRNLSFLVWTMEMLDPEHGHSIFTSPSLTENEQKTSLLHVSEGGRFRSCDSCQFWVILVGTFKSLLRAPTFIKNKSSSYLTV